MRNFIFETIDDSNKAHLQSCINNLESVSIGKLVELLKRHRQQSESAVRTALNIRLQDLKNRGFPNKYEQQLTRLDEWFDLVVRGKAANPPTYTGYTVTEDLLISMRNYNESIFQTHYDRMLQQERMSEPANFKGLIDELRQKLSANRSTGSSFHNLPRSTFASLQGSRLEAIDLSDKEQSDTDLRRGKRKNNEKSNQGGSNTKRRKKRQDCPCGRCCA